MRFECVPDETVCWLAAIAGVVMVSWIYIDR